MESRTYLQQVTHQNGTLSERNSELVYFHLAQKTPFGCVTNVVNEGNFFPFL